MKLLVQFPRSERGLIRTKYIDADRAEHNTLLQAPGGVVSEAEAHKMVREIADEIIKDVAEHRPGDVHKALHRAGNLRDRRQRWPWYLVCFGFGVAATALVFTLL